MTQHYALDQVPLADSHLSGALALSTEVRWNQTEEDWRVMLYGGVGHGLVSAAGQLVAAAVALPYGPYFGWISMVLVTKSWRRRGVATELFGNCIADLEQRGLTPALDATPEGVHVYARLGFQPGFEFCRWQHDGLQPRLNGGNAVLSRPAKPDDLDTVLRHDAEVASCDRADSVFSGEIIEVQQRTIGTDFDTDLPRETGATIVMSWRWKDLRSGELLRERGRFLHTTTYIPPVGESFETGMTRGLDGMAERIVEAMEKNW